MKTDIAWLCEQFVAGTPPPVEKNFARWGEQLVMLPGSARLSRFSLAITPWLTPAFEWLGNSRIITLVKPVQSGGSVFGEVSVCYWAGTATNGDIQWNWEDDVKADERWDKRILKILEGCRPVSSRFPMQGGTVDRSKFKRGLINFAHGNLIVQGIFSKKNVDSDSIRFQVNEEIHNWEPGRLQKAYNRTTAVWNSQIINISNAGVKGDQLHQAFESGTMQHLEWKCPKCGFWQVPRIRSEKDKPGGLRYDSEGCKLENGRYDYVKLRPTIYYECENPDCLHRVRDTPTERRQVAEEIRAGKPQNPGAPLTNRSFTYEAVVVDYIPWVKLIEEKHNALRAMRHGDNELWIQYLQERECKFWDSEDRPLVGKVEVTPGVMKNREGLPNRIIRVMTVDKQAGSAVRGEVPHYWSVIRDWAIEGNKLIAQLVFEGRIGLDEDIESRRIEYGIEPRYVLIDSGYRALDVYKLCFRFGYTPIKGEDRENYSHRIREGDTERVIKRIYSPPSSVDAYQGTDKEGAAFVDLILYSKQGIRNRLASLRTAPDVEWRTPVDVSEDYQRHMEAEEEEEITTRDGGVIYRWQQRLKRNDLFVCECYQVLLADMAGIFDMINLPEEKTPPVHP